MTHWADEMLANAPRPEPKPPRPPMTTGQKIAAGVLFSFLAFWAIALAVSWNHEPDDAVICNDGARYPSASAVMACLDQHAR